MWQAEPPCIVLIGIRGAQLTAAIMPTCAAGRLQSSCSTLKCKIAIFANGVFADRQTEMARRHGANVLRLEKEWGKVFTQEEAAAFI